MDLKTVFLCFMMILLCGCATRFEAFKSEPIDLPKVEKYDIKEDIDKLSKPTKIQRRYARFTSNSTLEFVDDPKNADVFVLMPSEYTKINVLKELAITYKSVIFKQEELVNLKNETINELQKLLKLTERERDIALRAWENSENAYRQEKAAHHRDNIINKTGMYIVTVGSIILLCVGL